MNAFQYRMQEAWASPPARSGDTLWALSGVKRHEDHEYLRNDGLALGRPIAASAQQGNAGDVKYCNTLARSSRATIPVLHGQ